MDKSQVFNQHRRLLFSIAYRMLGSVMEAEDMVQETFLRWHEKRHETVDSPKGYLTTTITRLCIDHLRSARVRRETYVGPWLPEPLLSQPTRDPDDSLALAESLSMAFLVLLESLTPVERATFLLHDVFEYDYGTIAKIVGKQEANCRQMVSRARRHLAARQPRFQVSAEQQNQVVTQFMHAAAGGDMEGLMAVLAEDVTWWSDGGGVPGVARKPVRGAERVARFLLNLVEKAPPETTYRPATINGDPGFITYLDGRPFSAVSMDVVGAQIQAIHAVVNPEKLRALPPLDQSQRPLLH